LQPIVHLNSEEKWSQPGCVALLLVIWAVSGCYSVRMIRDGQAEVEIGRRQGPVAIDVVSAPTPERPLATIQASHHPVRLIRRGGDTSVILRKRPHATLALGVGLQWWATLVWLRHPCGLTAAAAATVNVFGVASLLAGGRHGGYLGWLLPEILRYDYLSNFRELESSAGSREPLDRTQVTLESRFGRWTDMTGPRGGATVHLIRDLGLATSADDRPMLVSAWAGGSREVIAFQPRDFLHGYFAFEAGSRLRVSGDGSATLLAASATYRLLGRRDDGRYDVRLDDDTRGVITPAAPPRLVRYGEPRGAAPYGVVRLHSPRCVAADGRTTLRSGQSGRLFFDLEYDGRTNLGRLHLRLQVAGSVAPIELATSGDLGRPRSRGIAHRSIAFTCRTDAMAGRYVVQLLVEASGAVVAEAELVVEVEP